MKARFRRFAWPLTPLLVAALVLALVPTMPALADTVAFTSTADSWLSSRSGETGNHGSDTELRIMAGNRYPLVMFDLSSIPSEATITSARMRTYVSTSFVSGGTVDAHRITSTWTESGVTWSSRPSYSGTATSSISVTGTGWTPYWDVTSDVLAFRSGTYTNYGWWLKDNPDTFGYGSYFRCWSRDYTTDPTLRPQLEVTYTTGPSAPTVTLVDPDEGTQGDTLSPVITGTDFTGATAVSFGAGITVDDFIVDNATQITADITIDGAATPGARDVSVTTAGGTGTLTGGFTVNAAPSIEISAPTDITDWALSPQGDQPNEQEGTLGVTCSGGWEVTAKDAEAATGGKMTDWDGADYSDIQLSNYLTVATDGYEVELPDEDTIATGSGNDSVYVYFRQDVSWSDQVLPEGHSYRIIITFTGNLTP